MPEQRQKLLCLLYCMKALSALSCLAHILKYFDHKRKKSFLSNHIVQKNNLERRTADQNFSLI